MVLPEVSGGFEVWDWNLGLPIRSLGGVHAGEHLAYPCGEEGLLPGCFAPDGKTWLTAKTWRGGDDGQALMGTGMDGSGTWDQSVSMTIQLDPRLAVIHMVGPGDGVYEIEAETGDAIRLGDLPSPIRIGEFSASSCLSSDGRWLLVRHPHPTVPERWGWWAIWSLPEGRCRAYLFDSDRPAGFPGFSVDGATAFISGNQAWAWSGQRSDLTRASYPWSENGFGPSALTVDQGRTQLIRKGEGILEVRRAKGRDLVRRLVAFPPSNELICFSPNSNLLLATPPSGRPWLWNRQAPIRPIPAQIEEGPLQRPGFSALDYGSARSLAWSLDGARVAVGLDGGSIGVYKASAFRRPDGTPDDDASLGKPAQFHLGLNASVRGLAFTPDGLVALAQDGTVAIWRTNEEQPAKTWKAHACRSNSLQVSPDTRIVATGSLDGASLWSIADGTCLRRLGGAHSGVSCLHFDSKGQRLAVTYLDGWLAVFGTNTGKVLWETQAHSEVAAAVAFHPSGEWLVSLGWDSRLCRWNAKTGSATSSHEAPKAAGCLEWSRDGKWLAVGGSNPQVRDSSLGGIVSGLDFLWDAECT